MVAFEDKSYKRNFCLNIKSKFILKKIFNILSQKRMLQIINYNKKLQKILYKDIKDFKEYKNIILEIEPYSSGKFINIQNNNESSYIHIFLDDDKNEIKNKYLVNNEDKDKKIKIIFDFEIKSLRQIFEECDGIKQINFVIIFLVYFLNSKKKI